MPWNSSIAMPSSPALERISVANLIVNESLPDPGQDDDLGCTICFGLTSSLTEVGMNFCLADRCVWGGSGSSFRMLCSM